ncbi:hypothetical protein CTI12_AA375930 [Artemisia annua]|uniref:Uncharacterized protein n=1 Tax=Artemisia annua TaxID=35608 RepID=A0A2U1MIG1_ARTAN|nr:hypothetical protein CTI12_AA375930 [Artemisia annua]
MAEGDVALDDTVHQLLNIDEEVQNRSKHHSWSIYMVPSVIRDLSPRYYTPQVVSIGPLHHEDKHLIGFEVHKATYMHNLFHNVLHPLDSTPEQIMKACVTRVSGSIDQIKARYIGMKPYPDSKLVKMMVTDACFILAFIYNHNIGYSPLGENGMLCWHILIDMFLIENQIPFFVLQDIFERTFLKLHPALSLADFIFRIQKWCNIYEGDLVTGNSRISSTHDHILGFLHKSYQNPDREPSRCLKRLKGHSVVELDRSGVRFGKKLDAKWPMAMELEFSRFLCFPLSWSKPTLKMPVLTLYDGTESIIRNLIIYEQSALVQTCVTSYMKVMDMLIDIPEDVAMLTKSQVLSHGLGSDAKAANLMNNMLKEIPITDFYYADEWEQIDKYYNAYWPNHIAQLNSKYFSNPWSIIALIAGFVLFVLTVVQTVYGVKAAWP